MRLAAVHHLKGSSVLRDRAQPVEIREQQIGPLVRGGAPREPDGERVGIELHAGSLYHLIDELPLGAVVRLADLVEWDRACMSEKEAVASPLGKESVEELPHG